MEPFWYRLLEVDYNECCVLMSIADVPKAIYPMRLLAIRRI